jgi:hypothetical protein
MDGWRAIRGHFRNWLVAMVSPEIRVLRCSMQTELRSPPLVAQPLLMMGRLND